MVKAIGNRGQYVVYRFDEEHTHEMVPNIARHFMKSSRKLEIGHKKFMLSCAKANLGPVKSYNLMKELVGGYGQMRAMATDFKNYKRDLLANISAADAQMVINKLKNNKEMCSAFYFEYDVDDSHQLTRLFWCDPLARRNYAAFGQVVSFDSTYRTNRYCMVFAPFTGLDNHKKCVTFGCGLVVKEDVESYVWLFQQFQKAMGQDPDIMITDQDCAMKIAMEQVFTRTRHRLCMWHIMEKVSKKVGAKKISLKDFRKTLGHLVWSYNISVQEFEEGWKAFIRKYDLEKNTWLSDMYDLRHHWIPAYFRDILLGGLVRTTSISESQNSFFGTYSRRTFSLVELLSHFESALEKQRYRQSKNDFDSSSKAHDLKTPLAIEKHASEVYTLNIFSEVQEEINASCFYCCVTNETKVDDEVHFMIKEGVNDVYNVEYMVKGGFTTCSCLMYNRVGIPCRHIFTALKSVGCKKIPDSLIHGRWRKEAAKNSNYAVDSDVLSHCVEIEERKSKVNELWSVIYSCVGLVEDNTSHLDHLLKTLKDAKSGYVTVNDDGNQGEDIMDDVETFAGIRPPVDIEVNPPPQAKNKGCGKRLRGGKEASMENQAATKTKGARKCKACGGTGHDSRNCDKFI